MAIRHTASPPRYAVGPDRFAACCLYWALPVKSAIGVQCAWPIVADA